MTKKVLFSKIISEEAAKIGALYANKPYSCAVPESVSTYSKYEVNPEDVVIERLPDRTNILIKPVKGTGRRKPFILMLWK